MMEGLRVMVGVMSKDAVAEKVFERDLAVDALVVGYVCVTDAKV